MVITRNFPPLLGGMERLNLHLVRQLENIATNQLSLIAPKGASEHVPATVQTHEVGLRPLSRFLMMASLLAATVSRRWKPKVVLAGSGLTAPMAWLAARLCGARAYVYVHGLDLTVPHPLYRALWLPAIRRMDGIIVNSNATAYLARDIGIASERINVIPPGVSMPERETGTAERFRCRYALQGQKVLLSVGRLAARKGLCEFVRDVLPDIVRQHPDTTLVIVGSLPSNALYCRGQSPESIQLAADQAGVGKHIRLLGNIDEASLIDAYAGADVHVFPVRDIPGDPEGFGMVAIEAAAHGLPTVAYASGGVVDAVSEGISGQLVPAGNSAAFTQAVLALLEKPLAQIEMRNFAEKFSWSSFAERLQSVLASRWQ